ncbi:uncharacterized protein LOC115735770 [Rhodamnia argentea]|uniref:Uncharacterized protein LOC115735770 n=1 Tax=Rhodamnia argentea TaxID=178133 RepID=A0A8B8NLK7_9MYRT|nr:uncharacterized protein LOC115735770 [Rhodamnia argentea]
MRNTKVASKQSKIKHLMSAPLRIMSKAKNFYMRNMEDFAGRVGQNGGVGGPAAAQVTTLPKSFSVNSSKERDEDEDFRELVRAVSKRRGLDMTGFESRNGYGSSSGTNNVYGVGRSQSVGLGKIGRIDENIPADEFEEDRLNLKADSAYPRSRSHAVGRRNVGLY